MSKSQLIHIPFVPCMTSTLHLFGESELIIIHKSYIAYFRPDGMVVMTKTFDGRVERDTERYRIVGETLIINKQDYIINAPFKIDGRQLFMDTGKRSVVFQRVDM